MVALLVGYHGSGYGLSCIESENSLDVDVAQLFEQADIVFLARAATRLGGHPQQLQVLQVWKGALGETAFVESWYRGVGFDEPRVVFATGPRDRGQYFAIDDCLYAPVASVRDIVRQRHGPGREPSGSDDQSWLNTAWLLFAIVVSAAGLWLWQLMRAASND